jgi:hypothetical protein
MSTGPSEAYRQHHDVAAPQVDARAFRQGWRVATRLDALVVEGAIEPWDYEAAQKFRRDWDAAIGQRAPSLMTLRGAGGAGRDGGAIDRLGAATRLRRIADELGRFEFRLLEQCVVLDQSWALTGRQHQVADTTARRWTINALRRLGAMR